MTDRWLTASRTPRCKRRRPWATAREGGGGRPGSALYGMPQTSTERILGLASEDPNGEPPILIGPTREDLCPRSIQLGATAHARDGHGLPGPRHAVESRRLAAMAAAVGAGRGGPHFPRGERPIVELHAAPLLLEGAFLRRGQCHSSAWRSLRRRPMRSTAPAGRGLARA
eukprot:CAMPEP_0115461532 /NCGR_PEP_ID=MMETSP0271-20121206/47351_2 /TAXON_ID=71861 /ORGANISM="Scrippsiella trochoidea, Strain CCMP3099" /LENGTH=169 /DNA_ID=CAMNT_0002888279 /DNA_START=85 /DNA_END=592 /DNA_ORIENTATION=-